MEDLAGKQLGPYQIVERLGEGGMATVFKAYQPRMDRYLALKVMARHFLDNPEFVSRFSQEAQLIAKLEHPHILPVHDFGEAEGYTYLAMRLVEGGSLSDLLNKRRKLDLTQTNRIISQVGGALEYAHEKGVIHRDLKPGNILIDEFKNCLLTDFGIAKLMESTSHLTHTGGILGTPAYIAPEQGLGKTLDSRSDIYSLGIVLYEMTVGDVPYKADTPMAVIYKHIHDPLPLPRQRVLNFPEPIECVILKALAKNPDDRYSTTAELVEALHKAIEQHTTPVQAAKEPIISIKPAEVVIKSPDDPMGMMKIGQENRFIVDSNGIVNDMKTGLEWYAGPDEDTNWEEAKLWAKNLTVAGGGWRLPTGDELKTLWNVGELRIVYRDEGKRNIPPLFRTTGMSVWSGEKKGWSLAWSFDLVTGTGGWSRRDPRYHYGRGFAVRSRK